MTQEEISIGGVANKGSSFFSISRIFSRKLDNVISGSCPWLRVLSGTFSFPNPIESLSSSSSSLYQVTTVHPVLQIDLDIEHLGL